MNSSHPSHIFYLWVWLIPFIIAGCDHKASDRIQGYVEGEFVYIASPYAGQLVKLSVQRGVQVKQGDDLYTLDSVAEKAIRDEAHRRLTQAQANLEDAKKGKRPTEIESLNAQLKQAQAALILSEAELGRQKSSFKSGATSVDDLEKAQSTQEQNKNRVEQLLADLKTAQLGLREDQIASAEAEVRARESFLKKAEWDLAQKRQTAPLSAQVFDVLYQEGEWVGAGRPVIVLLPPKNIKVRTFVSETQVGSIHVGDGVIVHVDGVAEAFNGHVTFISPQAEYTPPVIYSQGSRDKLVFLIELRFDDSTAAQLHPGQPVDVRFTR